MEPYSVQCGTLLILLYNSNRVAISRPHDSHNYRILYCDEQLNEEMKGAQAVSVYVTKSQIKSNQVSSGG